MDGLLIPIYIDSIMVLVKLWSSLPTILKLSTVVVLSTWHKLSTVVTCNVTVGKYWGGSLRKNSMT